MPPSSNPNPSPAGAAGLREGDPCLADGRRGIVNAVYHSESGKQTGKAEVGKRKAETDGAPTDARQSKIVNRKWYRVRFPMGSPYLDDWAVFRADECTAAPPPAKDLPPEKYKENYPTEKNS